MIFFGEKIHDRTTLRLRLRWSCFVRAATMWRSLGWGTGVSHFTSSSCAQASSNFKGRESFYHLQKLRRRVFLIVNVTAALDFDPSCRSLPCVSFRYARLCWGTRAPRNCNDCGGSDGGLHLCHIATCRLNKRSSLPNRIWTTRHDSKLTHKRPNKKNDIIHTQQTHIIIQIVCIYI